MNNKKIYLNNKFLLILPYLIQILYFFKYNESNKREEQQNFNVLKIIEGHYE